MVALFEAEVAVVAQHDLAREAQTDARAVGLGGIERQKNVLDLPERNGLAVVDHADDGLVVAVEVGSDADDGGSGLHRVLDQVVEHLHQLAFVGIDEQVGRVGLVR